MSDKLLKASNAVLVREQPVSELVDENISLNRKNRLLWAGLIGLSALSTLSIGSCWKNANNLEKARVENTSLKQQISSLKEDVSDLTSDNQYLRQYEGFVHSIVPFYGETIGAKSERDEIIDGYKSTQERKQWDDACKVLGIDPKELLHLKGLER